MYGVYTYIYHKNQPNVGKYTYMDPMGYGIFTYMKTIKNQPFM